MVRVQNKIAWGLVVALSLLVLAAMAGVVRGGPLDPTAPPGSTGKNVITSLPFTISQEGSYVLNGNLTGVANQNGITVAANNVTIDLQGFELIGVNNALAGISASNTFVNIAVRNGTVRGWPVAGISLAGLVSHIENVQVHSGGGTGISTGAASSIRDSIASTNGGTEIVTGARSTVENCTADGNATPGNGIEVGDDSVVRGCAASNNGGVEIKAGNGSTLESCTSDGAGAGGNGIEVATNSVVDSCSTKVSPGDAVAILAGQGSRLENCSASDGGSGITAEISVGADSIVRACNVSGGGGPRILVGDGGLVESCVVDGLYQGAPGFGAGIVIGNNSTVRGCNVKSTGSGIHVTGSGNIIEGNKVSATASYGIDTLSGTNRVESNEVTGNASYGIWLGGGANVGMGNRSQNNCCVSGDNCKDVADDSFVVVFGAGFSSATHPWMNLC